MSKSFGTPSQHALEEHGLHGYGDVYWSLPAGALVEQVARQRTGLLTEHGALVVTTGRHTGRAPNDKFVVRHGDSADEIWWGEVNLPFAPESFQALHDGINRHWRGRDLYVQDLAAGADAELRLPIRVVSESAWHSLFARNLFLRPGPAERINHRPEFTVLHAPSFKADPERHGTNSEVFILLDFEAGLVLIGGTSYAGEIKKSIFTVLNYRMPLSDTLSMHCSANRGTDGDVALFFGLSGTGKTTLSSDPRRSLIGDDEHGWSDRGIFNFEGGCYAKTIRLSERYEPVIWNAAKQFGTVLENVILDETSRQVDFDDDRLTENTRAGYPLYAVDGYVEEGVADHPSHIFFLTADAFGVMPPIAKLSAEQAMYYFLSGYTSKLGGTEKGLGDEPQATFSACFGEPFLPLHPTRYAELLGQRIDKHAASVWLINTGWTGGAYGAGERIQLPYTRAMVSAALQGSLDKVETRRDPVFGFEVPVSCPGVPESVLDPRQTWADPAACDQQANRLAEGFTRNFEQYADLVPRKVTEAGPPLSVP